MLKTFATAALLATVLAPPVRAEQVTISQALAAGSLHEGPLDMVAYWRDGPNGALELTATFRDRATDDAPMRIVMPMQDGDAVAFGMPGHAGALYGFARTGREIRVSVEAEPEQVAGTH